MLRRSCCALALIFTLSLFLASCSVFRGLPTHGGGKRFDEEERVVSGSIRRAIADMDLKELRGKAVLVNLESISHNGGGYATFPGISGASFGYSKSDAQNGTSYLRGQLPDFAFNPDGSVKPAYYSYLYLSDNFNLNNSKNWNAGASVNNFSYNATAMGTDADLNYLRSSLTMKIQHNGINVVAANPDYILYILVDVLGTNRSRRDSLLYWSDNLRATCEVTYYAQDAKTGLLLFRARQAAAISEYEEASLVGFTGFKIRRAIKSTDPTPMPVDGEAGVLRLSEERVELLGLKSKTNHTSETVQRASINTDVQLKDAELQLQIGNLNEARRLIDTVRQTNPNSPLLGDVESKFQQRQQEMAPFLNKP